MLVLGMVVAACWGVVQLHVLGSATRTVRLSTSLRAVAIGAYGCGVAAILVQWVVTRLWANLTGNPILLEVVQVAGYTTNPFIEEFVKVAPLALASYVAKTRFQWSVTDYLVVGGGLGAGFGLIEAVMRFGTSSVGAQPWPTGGWVIPNSLVPPFIPSFWIAATSWLPAPVSFNPLEMLGPDVFKHLVWSAVAGAGVGIFFRVSAWWRWVGMLFVVWAGIDHAASNYEVTVTEPGELGSRITGPFLAVEGLLWLWPLLALGLAVLLDTRTLRFQRKAHPELLLHGEGPALTDEVRAFGRYARVGWFWSTFVINRFVLLRRSALYASAGRSSESGELRESVGTLRSSLDRTADRSTWQGKRLLGGMLRAGKPPETSPATWLVRRYWPVLLWLGMLTPVAFYHGSSAASRNQGIKQSLANSPWYQISVGVMALAVLWIGWNLFQSLRGLRSAGQLTHNYSAVRLLGSIWTGSGVLAFSIVVGYSALSGAESNSPFWSNLVQFHIIDALTALILIAAVMLIIAAVVLYPPSVIWIAIGGGAAFPVGIAAGGGFVALTGLGASLGAVAYILQTLDPDSLGGLRTEAGVVLAEALPVSGEWETGPKPPVPLEAEIDQIAEHAWDQHVEENNEFPEVETIDDLKEVVTETIEHATRWGYREDGAVYWYDEVTDTVVIKNPPGIGGTTYRPGESQP